MMECKVIFDTNAIRSKPESQTFFGSRDELRKFSRVSEIVVPGIVLDEIRNQKFKYFKSKLDSLINNPITETLKLEKTIKKFNPENFVKTIESKEEFSFKVIELTTSDVINEIRKMAVNNHAPFDLKTDKGFKDCYIYFTILEMLDDDDESEIFLVTADGRLKEALQKIDRITVIENYEEFVSSNKEYFYQDYFLGKLKDELSINATVNDIQEVRQNLDGDWVIKLNNEQVESEWLLVDFTSKEMLMFMHGDYHKFNQELISCSDPGEAVRFAITVIGSIPLFTEQEIEELLEAMAENGNIIANADNEFIKDLYITLARSKSESLDKDLKDKLNKYYGEF